MNNPAKKSGAAAPANSASLEGQILIAMPTLREGPFARFIEKVSTPLLRDKVSTVEAWAASGAIRPISAVDLFFCIWAMTQAYADFVSQMTIMKRKRALQDADYDTAKATIVQ